MKGNELEALLSERLERARLRWPTVVLAPDQFARHLAERVCDDVPTAAALRTDDLYLACACANGDDAAVVAFRDEFMRGVRVALSRFNDATLCDEMCQMVMEKLFVGSATRPPAIGKYSGRGSLQAWVNVMAVRDTYTRLRLKPREQPDDDIDLLVERAIDVREDSELAQLKAMYREQFKSAFSQALEILSPRDRNVLRHECVDDLNIDKIGELYGVHRATVARWRTRARQQLFEHTRAVFERDLNVSGGEFQSIMRLIHSQLGGSLPRLLAEAPDE